MIKYVYVYRKYSLSVDVKRKEKQNALCTGAMLILLICIPK